MLQLILNPGSLSTKLALFDDETCLVQENVEHDQETLRAFDTLPDQVPFRLQIVRQFMEKNNVTGGQLSAVIGRGGLVYGLHTGGYAVTDELCRALTDREYSQMHASNLGGLMARELAKQYGLPAYIYDAVTSGDLPEVARITGLPDIRRHSFCHVLNSRAMAMRYAREQGRRYEDMTLIVAHLGSGISLSAHRDGAIVDSIGDDEVQFSPERIGGLPVQELVRLCYSGRYTEKEMTRFLRGGGGMTAYLGTGDCRIVERRITAGDRKAEQVFRAMAYTVVKAIGELAAVLRGGCEAIILTGGLAYSQPLTDLIRSAVEWIAPVAVLPGENEMQALAQGGLRILRGEEQAREYHFSDKD